MEKGSKKSYVLFRDKLSNMFRRVSFMTSKMLPDSNEEEVVKAIAREIVVLLMSIMVTAVISLIMTTSALRDLSRSLDNAFTKTKFRNLEGATISFYDIETANDFWTYSETVLLNALYFENWYDDSSSITSSNKDDQNSLFENSILGVPRIRQLRVRNNSCSIHDYMVGNFVSCYGPFSKWAEDKTSFGHQRGTAWSYNTPKDVNSVNYYGFLGVYGSGGYYEKLATSNAGTTSILSDLKGNFWLTKGTRVIIYEFTVFNANVDLFCTVKIVFEFPPTGGVVPSASFRPAYLTRYTSDNKNVILALETAFMVLLLYYTMEVLQELLFFKAQYFIRYWNYVDLTCVLTSYAIVFFSVKRYFATEEALKRLLIVSQGEQYGNFEKATDCQVKFDYCIAVLLFLQCIKLFKYFEYNKKLGQLNNTLRHCTNGITGFTLLFLIVFFAYAELGYLLFGSQVKSFCGFITSMMTLFRTILGDFNYIELEEADRIYAPIFFISYIFVVLFILTNMFLAIVTDAYADCKVEMVLGERNKRSQLMTRALHNILNKFNWTRVFFPSSIRDPKHYYITVKKAEFILNACGFNETEVATVISRCGGDYYKKTSKIDIMKLMKEADPKTYQVPSLPDLPKKVSTSKVTPTIVESDFIEQNKKIDEIESVLADLTHQVEGLIEQLTTAFAAED